MKFAGKTETGLRPHNEDNYLIFHTAAVNAAAVSDGMGGHRAGEVASRLAIESLQAMLINPRIEPETALSSAFSAANTAVYTHALGDDDCFGMGCTLVAAVMDAKHFTAANVGDSRLYRFDGQILTQITHDHSFVAELVRRGAITAEEAKTHPRRNLITRAIGTEGHIRTDLFSCEWNPGDILLLCSDGLCGVLDSEEISECLRNSTDLDGACDSLISRALAAGSRDNITVVLVQNDGGNA